MLIFSKRILLKFKKKRFLLKFEKKILKREFLYLEMDCHETDPLETVFLKRDFLQRDSLGTDSLRISRFSQKGFFHKGFFRKGFSRKGFSRNLKKDLSISKFEKISLKRGSFKTRNGLSRYEFSQNGLSRF